MRKISVILCLAACSPAATPSSEPEKSPAAAAVALSGTLVRTPFGEVDAACAQRVSDGEIVVADRGIQRADGTFAARCNESTRQHHGGSSGGSSGSSSGGAISELDGWVEYAQYDASATPASLATTWVVPALPATEAGQTLFFFPSFMPADDSAIIQPVLQYGPSSAGGGSSWTLASWFVDSAGNANWSTLLGVNPGDTLTGSITSSNCTSAGACTYVIVGNDVTTSASTTLTVSESVPYTSIQAGVMEVYGVASCGDFPPDGQLAFGDVSLLDDSGNTVNESWSSGTLTIAPAGECGFAFSSSSSAEVALSY